MSPASRCAVPWGTASSLQVCDFPVISSVSAFGSGTGYSALNKAMKTRACGAPMRDWTYETYDHGKKKQMFFSISCCQKNMGL